MLRIWEKFVEEQNELDKNISIKEAYANERDIKISWIKDDLSMTIQEWIDKCCDELEYEGHDLNQTPLHFVKEKFVKYDITIVPPVEYKQLLDAKTQAENTLELLSKFKAPAETIQTIHQTIELLESKLKELS
tara:strand:+ start:70 stop:468 length:399 start_codon:yes stop_codon:yes gene_type:complete